MSNWHDDVLMSTHMNPRCTVSTSLTQSLSRTAIRPDPSLRITPHHHTTTCTRKATASLCFVLPALSATPDVVSSIWSRLFSFKLRSGISIGLGSIGGEFVYCLAMQCDALQASVDRDVSAVESRNGLAWVGTGRDLKRNPATKQDLYYRESQRWNGLAG